MKTSSVKYKDQTLFGFVDASILIQTASIADLMGEFHKNRNNSTVFEKLSVSIVDLTNSFFSGRNLTVHVYCI
jgi:hypothetical protein